MSGRAELLLLIHQYSPSIERAGQIGLSHPLQDTTDNHSFTVLLLHLHKVRIRPEVECLCHASVHERDRNLVEDSLLLSELVCGLLPLV